MVTTKKSWRLTQESHWILAMSTIDCTMSCVILFGDLMNYTNCSFNDLYFVRMDARRWFYQTQLTSDEILSGHNIQGQGILKNKTQGEKKKQNWRKTSVSAQLS